MADSRLYAQYQPDRSSLDYLLQLQRKASSINPTARLVSEKQIHLTIIHFGVIDEVFPQVQAVAPALDYKDYRQAINMFVHAVETAMASEVTVDALEWDAFGLNRRTLVITTTVPPPLQRTYADCLVALQAFFVSCGLAHPEKFMAGNQNFQYALTLKPHITLLKNAPNLSNRPFTPKNLQLEAMPILYD